MSRGQRIAIVVGAFAVLAAAFVLAQGAGDEGAAEEQAAREVVTDTTTAPPVQPEGGTGAARAPEGTQEEPRRPRFETIRMRGRAPVGEPRTITVRSGEQVRLRFVSDVAEEVHIHGYDRYVDVPAGGSARVAFEADAEGVFEIESHGSGAILAELEVRP